MAALDASRRFLRDARTSAEEEERPTPRGRELTAQFREIVASDAFGKSASREPRSPDERHAVGNGQVGFVDRLSEGDVGLSDAQAVEVDRYDLM